METVVPLAIDAGRRWGTGKGVSTFSGCTSSVQAGPPGQPCKVAGIQKGVIFRQA